jgi:hypothetical protein
MKPIVWTPPPSGLIKINCDAAVSQVGLKVAGGGVVRDSNGCFLWAFAVKLGSCSVAKAKL